MANAAPRTAQIPALTLRAELQPGSIDPQARTAQFAFSTGAVVRRRDWLTGAPYEETLSLEPGAVRMGRLNGGAPFLDAHNADRVADILGVVVPGSARIEKGLGIATVQFSQRPDVEPIWRDVQDGVLRNVSVGYVTHEVEETPAKGDRPMRRHAIDWEPFEISAVPMGADPGAQVRGGPEARLTTYTCVIQQRAEGITMDPIQATDLPPVQDLADPGKPVAVAAPVVESATEAQAAIAAERKRCQGIQRAVDVAGFPQSMADGFIKNGTSLEDAQTEIFIELGKRADQGGPGRIPARVEQSWERQVPSMIRKGIEGAILHRANPDYFPLDELGKKYRHYTLLDLARHCLETAGMRTTGLSRMEIAGLALGLNTRGALHTTSDFADILADVANKTLRRAYDEAPQTFTAIARRVEIPDFKPVRRVQLGEAPSLEKIVEHGEFTRGTIGQAKESYQLETYGKVFGITRQSLVNDDTDAFSRVAQLFGRSARNLESDLVWAQITGNPTMGDTVALFHASHGNLAGTSAVISVESIGVGRAAMRNQKGLDGVQYVNVRPVYLLVPPALETVADSFVSANLMASQASAVNPFAGKLQVVSEPRLEADSDQKWYLAADTGQIDIVEYGFLAGEAGPVVESRVGFDVDGLEIKARHDVAAKVIDWRGLFRNDGA